jgi:hypothetical protein
MVAGFATLAIFACLFATRTMQAFFKMLERGFATFLLIMGASESDESSGLVVACHPEKDPHHLRGCS